LIAQSRIGADPPSGAKRKPCLLSRGLLASGSLASSSWQAEGDIAGFGSNVISRDVGHRMAVPQSATPRGPSVSGHGPCSWPSLLLSTAAFFDIPPGSPWPNRRLALLGLVGLSYGVLSALEESLAALALSIRRQHSGSARLDRPMGPGSASKTLPAADRPTSSSVRSYRAVAWNVLVFLWGVNAGCLAGLLVAACFAEWDLR